MRTKSNSIDIISIITVIIDFTIHEAGFKIAQTSQKSLSYLHSTNKSYTKLLCDSLGSISYIQAKDGGTVKQVDESHEGLAISLVCSEF